MIATTVDIRTTKRDGAMVVTCLIGVTAIPRRDSDIIIVVVVVVVVVNTERRKIIFQQNCCWCYTFDVRNFTEQTTGALFSSFCLCP